MQAEEEEEKEEEEEEEPGLPQGSGDPILQDKRQSPRTVP